MLRIIVVGDEAPIRGQLVYRIQKCGAASSTISAANGEEAYRRILEQKPNVVFTDIRMPGMDGLEPMSKVRDISPFTVSIILTNYAEFSYVKQAISLGTREYILKSEMRSSDIQRVVAEIAATTVKIRSEKVHDVLQNGVVDPYKMHHNSEQLGTVTAFWQRQGLRSGWPYLAFYVANDNSLDLRRRTVALASAPRIPLPAVVMVQEHLCLLLQCPEVEALRGYALDTEAALGECRLPAGVSALCIDIGQLIRVLGEAASVQEACFFTGGGVVSYSAICGPPPIDREAAHARKQEVLRLLARRQVEEARGALRAWSALFGVVGADDVRWAVDTTNYTVIPMEDRYHQFVMSPIDGWEPPHSFTVCRSRCPAMLEQVFRERRNRHSWSIETALNYIRAHYVQPVFMVEVAAQLYRSSEHFSHQFREGVGEDFSSYFTRYWLERAQELLQTTDLSVASVAVQMGYTTSGYFPRLYKRYKGVFPETERRGSKP